MDERSAKIVEEYVFSIVLREFRLYFGHRPTNIIYSGIKIAPYKTAVHYEKNDKRTNVYVEFDDLRVCIEVSHTTKQVYSTKDIFERVKERVSWYCEYNTEKRFDVVDPASKQDIRKFVSEAFQTIKKRKWR